MNEMERDYIAAKAVGLELVTLVLRLWVIVFCVFSGLWVLGVILMYWHVIIPVGIAVVWWAARSTTEHPVVSGPPCDEPSSEDGR